MSLSLQDGDFGAAREAYAEAPSPPLILIETAITEGVPEAVDALAEVCEPTSNLILLGTVNDIDLYRTLNQRGIADYLVMPVHPARLSQSILDLFTDPARAPKGRAIAVLGVKGGCGSSTIAHTAASLLAEMTGAEVLLVDMDIPFGCADLTFNVENVVGIQNLLTAPDRIDEVLLQRYSVKHGDQISLLTAPTSLDADLVVAADSVERIVDSLKRYMRYVILDVPHLWAEWVRTVLRDADDVVVVAMPDLASMRNARNLIDFLHGFRPLDEPPILVLNRKGASPKGEIPIPDFSNSVGLAPLVIVPNDPDGFGLASSYGKLLSEVKPKSKALIALRTLAERLGRADMSAKASGHKTAKGGGLKALLGGSSTKAPAKPAKPGKV